MVHDQQFPGPHGRNAPRYAPAGARRSRHPCLKCYGWFCCGLFALALIFAAVVAGFWAIVNPSLPKYTVFGITSNAYNFTNDFKFHGRFVVNLGSNNLNKYITIVYEKDSTVDLLFRDGRSNFVKLCSGMFPEFKQPTANITSMNIDLKGDLTKGDFGGSANTFNEKVKSNSIPLVVAVKTHGEAIILGHNLKVELAANCSMDVDSLSAGKEGKEQLKMSNMICEGTNVKYFI
ncbi:PREDICTED: uncharacterized protein LOC101304502 [Fragaria vesca subsp. vesca]|uniref:uncharacterized protein LOC101304502 n=1 Tax=Fragaria vesca subsp. vesca TaxID=101020 RepID=UPI0002C334C3|nr:PREDICTED: uncharacterized protein LOC101304502 [Fragaria vesca subsp. vesca]